MRKFVIDIEKYQNLTINLEDQKKLYLQELKDKEELN